MEDDRFYKEIDKESGFHTKSILCVPLQADGHTIGAIELMNMRADYLSDSGLKILSVIADHAALAIDNARLLAQTRQQSEEQAFLFEAMAIVISVRSNGYRHLRSGARHRSGCGEPANGGGAQSRSVPHFALGKE
jgi:GAF domain-containing protein